MVGGSVGEMVIPLVVGFFIGENPMMLIYTNEALVVAMAIVFVALHCVGGKHGKKKSKDEA